jgi:hypothetical protein
MAKPNVRECTHEITAGSKAEAEQKARDYQDQLQAEHKRRPRRGHLGTNGTGVKTLTQRFDTVEAARVYILDNHKQWDKPMLARIKGTDTWLLCGWCPWQ